MKSRHLLISGFPMNAAEANIAGNISHIHNYICIFMKKIIFFLGLVSCLTTPDNLNQQVEQICTSILSKSYAVIKLGKQFYYKQLEMNLIEAYQMAENVMVENLQMYDGQEGIRSFMEKRQPIWRN